MVQLIKGSPSDGVPLWLAKGRGRLLLVAITSLLPIVAGFFIGLNILWNIVPVNLSSSVATTLAGMTILGFVAGVLGIGLTPVALTVGIWSLFCDIDRRIKLTIAYLLAANLVMAVILGAAVVMMGGKFPH